MLQKVWKLLPAPPDGFSDSIGLPPFQAQLIYNRGIRTAAKVAAFLRGDDSLSHDPFLLPDMDKAAARLRKALVWSEVVGIFGDFDTDGISGTALVTTALRSLGLTVVPYLPHRVEDGHGLNERAVKFLTDSGATLLITVDTGTSSEAEVEYAASLGVDTIITDHHSLTDDPPQATAIVNPRRGDSVYPYEYLTGAGLAFKLIEGFWQSLGKRRPDYLLELAALGTVADVAPLTGENRFIVKRGLDILNATTHPGLQALINRVNVSGTIDTESLSFSIIPRINAAGRLGGADISLELLTETDEARANSIVETLETKNEERKSLSRVGIEEARKQIAAEGNGRLPPLMFVENQDWLPGVLGLIAGSLSEEYYRPVVAVQRGHTTSRASARSIAEFDIIDAIRSTSSNFHRQGGHPEAAGFIVSTDELPQLKQELTEMAGERLRQTMLLPTIEIDCIASPSTLPGERFDFIGQLSPFGQGNPDPVFLMRKARVVDARLVGTGKNHLKLRVVHEGQFWSAIAFKLGEKQVRVGEDVDVVYNFGVNTWNGQTTFQLNVLDFKPSTTH